MNEQLIQPLGTHVSNSTPKKGIVGAYLIQHVKSGRGYAGSANDLQRRKRDHLYQLSKGTHPSIVLQELFQEDPELKWTFWLCRDREHAFQVEQELLDLLFKENCQINRAPQALHPSLGLTRSAEWRAKISDRNKGNQYSLGVKRTEEQNRANSERQKGKKRDPALVEAAAAKIRGRPQNPAHVAARALIMKDKAFRRAVVVDGKEYESIDEAHRQSGIKRATIGYRINSDQPAWSEYYYKDPR